MRRTRWMLWALFLASAAGAQEVDAGTVEETAPVGAPVDEGSPPPSRLREAAELLRTDPQGAIQTLASALDEQGRVQVQEVSPRPHLTWGAAVACAELAPSRAVPSGKYRIQCDDTRRVCHASPTMLLDVDGVEAPDPLERIAPCYGYDRDFDRRAREGYRFLLATAEAPPGWYRDDRGRVMQYNFDLHRRVYLGGGWAPTQLREGETRTDAARADFGVEIEWPDEDERVLRRIHLLETSLTFGVPQIDARLLRYDSSVDRVEPLFRVSTFIGKPRRLDVHFNLSPWFELLHLETLRRESEQASYLTFGSLHAALDFWHSRDQVSWIRFRAGPGIELDLERDFVTLNPGAAIEGDFTLDEDGFHHIEFSATAEALVFARSDALGRPTVPTRYKARAGYEVIFLAINDQPLSLLLEGNAMWRDDFLTVTPTLELSAHAGLRFSFWAPARRNAKAEPNL